MEHKQQIITILSQVAYLVAGSCGTAILWIVKSILHTKTDVDRAHCKIRGLEERLKLLEQQLCQR